MAKGRARRHRAQAFGRAPYISGGGRTSRYAPRPKRKGLGPNARTAKAGLAKVVAAADTASSLHGGLAAGAAAYGTVKAGKAYLARRRRKRGPRRDNKGRFT